VPESQEAASLREVHTLIDTLRTELLSEFKQLESMVDVRFERHDSEHATHNSEHKQHEQQHQRDRDHRASIVRWAVTTIVSAVGVLIALYAAFLHQS